MGEQEANGSLAIGFSHGINRWCLVARKVGLGVRSVLFTRSQHKKANLRALAD